MEGNKIWWNKLKLKKSKIIYIRRRRIKFEIRKMRVKIDSLIRFSIDNLKILAKKIEKNVNNFNW